MTNENLSKQIKKLLDEGPKTTQQIVEAFPAYKRHTIRGRLSDLRKAGKIKTIPEKHSLKRTHAVIS